MLRRPHSEAEDRGTPAEADLAYPTLLKDVIDNRHGREGVRPSGVERKMREDFRQLAGSHAAVEGQIKVLQHPDGLVARHQGRDRNDSAVSRRQVERVEPQLESGELIRVLEDWCQPFPGFFLYYPSRRQQPAALAALIATLKL